ncbi:MAG: hypothetical protein PHE06_13875 [Lachnospiraceae bacterium]|nr:hypothetical protein [Lachnospiraceae bacterium]
MINMDNIFMTEAIHLSALAVEHGNEPFGAVLVKDEKMVWTKLGTLVYAASNMELEKILVNEGCNCSKMVFAHSFHRPEVRAGVLREESLRILTDYFGSHAKG